MQISKSFSVDMANTNAERCHIHIVDWGNDEGLCPVVEIIKGSDGIICNIFNTNGDEVATTWASKSDLASD